MTYIQFKAIPIEQCPERLPIPKSAQASDWLVVRQEGQRIAEALMGFDTGVEACLVASWLWSSYLLGVGHGQSEGDVG